MNIFLVITALFVIVLLVVIASLDKNGNAKKTEYDERQKGIINEGFRYAALYAIAMNLLFGLVFGFADRLPFDASFMMGFIALSTTGLWAVYCISKGVYFGIREEWKRRTGGLLVIGLLNLFAAFIDIQNDGLMENGQLTLLRSANLLIGLLMTICAAAVFIQRLREKKNTI